MNKAMNERQDIEEGLAEREEAKAEAGRAPSSFPDESASMIFVNVGSDKRRRGRGRSFYRNHRITGCRWSFDVFVRRLQFLRQLGLREEAARMNLNEYSPISMMLKRAILGRMEKLEVQGWPIEEMTTMLRSFGFKSMISRQKAAAPTGSTATRNRTGTGIGRQSAASIGATRSAVPSRGTSGSAA